MRAALFGRQAPSFAGCVACRGLVPVARIADPGPEIGTQSWVGPGAHLVHYFVSRALGAFEGWHPQVRRIIGAAKTCFVWAAIPCRDGPSAAPRFSAMPATRCTGSWARGLRRHEAVRRPRVTRLQEMSRANKKRFHLRDGPAQAARDAQWARATDRGPDALHWVVDYDASALPT